MEFEEKLQETIPADIFKIIKEEVEKSVLPLREDDPWTAELDAEYELDCKIAQYIFLSWLKTNISKDKILYAGSGDDVLPKIVFGEDKVVHVSMENYNGWETIYFPELGSGMKLVADNIDMPFPDSSFDMVMFFGLFTNTTKKQLVEAVRVLKNDGLVVCDDTIASNLNLFEVLTEFQMVEVPEELQNRGISETSFTVFRKI